MGTVLRTPAISNVDLLSVLEVHIPPIRESHRVTSKIVVEITEWNSADIHKFDKGQRARTKATRAMIDEALRAFAGSSLRYMRLSSDQSIDNDNINLLSCQLLVAEFAQVKALLDKAYNAYQLPYKTLCDRVVSRSKSYASVDYLHLYYGSFNQAIVKFTENLTQAQQIADRVLEYQPYLAEWITTIIALGSYSTDAFNSLVKLNHEHHKNLNYLSSPLKVANYN